MYDTKRKFAQTKRESEKKSSFLTKRTDTVWFLSGGANFFAVWLSFFCIEFLGTAAPLSNFYFVMPPPPPPPLCL